jgi:hypothetical protein
MTMHLLLYMLHSRGCRHLACMPYGLWVCQPALLTFSITGLIGAHMSILPLLPRSSAFWTVHDNRLYGKKCGCRHACMHACSVLHGSGVAALVFPLRASSLRIPHPHPRLSLVAVSLTVSLLQSLIEDSQGSCCGCRHAWTVKGPSCSQALARAAS